MSDQQSAPSGLDDPIEQMLSYLGVENGVFSCCGSVASMRRSRIGDSLYIMHIVTEPQHRGEGNASAILAEICDAADRYGVTMFLEVEPRDDCSMTATELANWYWRFGFRGDPSEMIREPASNR